MKKLEKRAIICLVLAGTLILGLGYFVVKFAIDGNEWAGFYTNRAVHTNGNLSKGTLYDINGTLLLKNKAGKMRFASDQEIRTALVHITGDKKNNISTGANNVFADKLIGYNIINGTYSLTGAGHRINLSLDAQVCKAAYEALGDYNGTVGVYNYKTGEIICSVSSPNFDPTQPLDISADDTSGIYINRLYSSKMSPGSTFKLVTTAAAIENKSDWKSWHYNCTGSQKYGTSDLDRVTCLEPHGEVDLEEALAVSCNCGFGELANELGARTMKKTVKKLGLTSNYNIDGIITKASSFSFPSNADVNLAWAGVGQYKDLVNPASMMVYMGAIANGGEAVMPEIVHNIKFSNGWPASIPWKPSKEQMIDESTASQLADMMRNNVIKTYGTDTFPGLDICAKSGTAEVDKTKEPNALFAGFLRDDNNPYAFVVIVEEGGDGTSVAGTVANTVLQKIVNNN